MSPIASAAFANHGLEQSVENHEDSGILDRQKFASD